MKKHSRLGLLILALAVFAGPSVHADPEFFSYYRGAKRELQLDDTQIAVKLAAPAERSKRPSDAEARGVAQRAASLGYQAEEAGGLHPGGWIKLGAKPAAAKANFSSQATAREKINRLMNDLAGVADVQFLSPVFKDAAGNPVNFEPAILLGFVDGTSEAAQNAILQKIKKVKSITRHGPRNKWTIEINAKNGLDVLDAANELAVLPGVRYAEPNFIAFARVL